MGGEGVPSYAAWQLRTCIDCNHEGHESDISFMNVTYVLKYLSVMESLLPKKWLTPEGGPTGSPSSPRRHHHRVLPDLVNWWVAGSNLDGPMIFKALCCQYDDARVP